MSPKIPKQLKAPKTPPPKRPASTSSAKIVLRELQKDIAANDPLWIGADTVSRLRNAIEIAQIEMQAKLEGYFTGKNHLSDFDMRRMRDLRRELADAMEQIGNLDRVARADKRTLRAEISSAARADMLRQYEIVRNATVFDFSATSVNLRAAEQIARKGILLTKFDEHAQNYSAWFKSRIEQELLLAQVKKMTIGETAQQLYRTIPGAFEDGYYWAERLVRNETMNAYGAAHMEYFQDLASQEKGWKLRWDSARDSRTCPICRSLDNQVVNAAEGEKFKAEWRTVTKGKGGKGPKGATKRLEVERPPAHIQCRCSAWPWRAEFTEYMDTDPTDWQRVDKEKPVWLKPKEYKAKLEAEARAKTGRNL